MRKFDTENQELNVILSLNTNKDSVRFDTKNSNTYDCISVLKRRFL